MGTARGAIICESLKPGTSLEGHGMTIVRLARYEAADTPDWQPPVWTMVEFEAPDDVSDRLAQELAEALRSPGWYANWNTDAEAVVVFPNRIFRYRHGDLAAREEAKEHGRRCGVPEPQLDWTD